MALFPSNCSDLAKFNFLKSILQKIAHFLFGQEFVTPSSLDSPLMKSPFVAFVSSPLLSTRPREICNRGKEKKQAQTNNKIQTQHNSCKQAPHNFDAWS